MKLFKNVDICDLASILEKGLLSLDESGNDNWDDGYRGDNRTDVVYLFSPLKEENSFPKSYGVALVELEVENAVENEIAENDRHKGDYVEYIVPEAFPEQIKNIYIPRIFQDKLKLTEDIAKCVTWCGMSAKLYRDFELVDANSEDLRQFSETAEIRNSSIYGYFRGEKNREVIDLYNIKYEF